VAGDHATLRFVVMQPASTIPHAGSRWLAGISWCAPRLAEVGGTGVIAIGRLINVSRGFSPKHLGPIHRGPLQAAQVQVLGGRRSS